MLIGIFDNPLWGGGTEWDRKRNQLRRNKRRGRAAEDMVEMELRMQYDEVESVREGADFRARRRDLWTGEVVEETQVEVKSGNAPLSERQKKERRRSDNYEVRRRNPLFF